MRKTLENLTMAFVGESQARNRYTFYATVAKKAGYEQIASIFLMTAEQERAHAKRLFEHIQELKAELKDSTDSITVEAVSPNLYDNTIANLKAAIAGEMHESEEMYPDFAKVAEEEGLDKIAGRLRSIAIAEKHHAERYSALLKELENETVFKKAEKTWWVCRECGYIHYGEEAPQKCPSCDHPQAYYQVRCEEY